jgi:hypothetical protein
MREISGPELSANHHVGNDNFSDDEALPNHGRRDLLPGTIEVKTDRQEPEGAGFRFEDGIHGVCRTMHRLERPEIDSLANGIIAFVREAGQSPERGKVQRGSAEHSQIQSAGGMSVLSEVASSSLEALGGRPISTDLYKFCERLGIDDLWRLRNEAGPRVIVLSRPGTFAQLFDGHGLLLPIV